MTDFKQKYQNYKLKYYALEDPSILDKIKKEFDEKNDNATDYEHKYNKYKNKYLAVKNKPAINMITPIKDGMTYDDAKSAILDYLNKYIFVKSTEIYPPLVLKCENRKDFKKIDRINESAEFLKAFTLKDCVHTQTFGTREMQYITLKDGSRWIRGAGGLARLVGAKYLERALIANNISNWDSVWTTFVRLNIDKDTITVKLTPSKNNEALFIDSTDFTTFSLFINDYGKDHINEDAKKYSKDDVEKITNYIDWGLGANTKIDKDGNVIIIDTEYGSFSHDNIDKLSDKTKEELGDKTFEFNIYQFPLLRKYEPYRQIWNLRKPEEIVPRKKTILDEDWDDEE